VDFAVDAAFESVKTAAAFAGFCAGACAELRVGAVGLELFVSHTVSCFLD
jgi:hypothetical protein